MKVDYYQCGDCVDLMKQLPDCSIDLVVTSPPYDDLRIYDSNSQFKFKSVAKQLCRVIKTGGVIVWVVGDSTKNGTESLESFRQALYFKSIGMNVYDTMIYKKTNPTPMTHRRYEQAFEYMFVFSKGIPKTFHPIMVPCKNAGKVESYGKGRRIDFDGKQSMRVRDSSDYRATHDTKIHSNIFEYSIGISKRGHPAPFPDMLADDMIQSFSNPEDVVLDPMCGSGTTLISAKKLERHYIGFEISQKYCDIISKYLN